MFYLKFLFSCKGDSVLFLVQLKENKMGKAKVRTLKSKNFHVDRNGSSPGLNDEEGEDEDETPSEIAVLENQVAGHMTDARSLG